MAKAVITLLLAVLIGCDDSKRGTAPPSQRVDEVESQTSENPKAFSSATDTKNEPDSIRIILNKNAGGSEDPVIEVTGLSGEELARFANPGFEESRLAKLLAVFVISETGTNETAMLGAHRVEDKVLRFVPRFPFEPGLKYRAVYDPVHLPGERSIDEAVIYVFELPQPLPGPPTILTSVYPSRDVLPENQLKFYFHFSGPMSRGESYKRIHLLDGSGKEVELPFLELGEELWDREHKRFTLLFDPGRIKRGLKPREDEGPSIEERKFYTLTVDQNWRDAAGMPLKRSFRKQFRVAAADTRQPDPKHWKLDIPLADSTQPLTVVFEESLDRGMLERVFTVTDETGDFVDGEIEIDRRETRWRFHPKQPWKAGAFELTVATTLEDLAGNSNARPCEVDLSRVEKKTATEKTVSLPFQVLSRDETGTGSDI